MSHLTEENYTLKFRNFERSMADEMEKLEIKRIDRIKLEAAQKHTNFFTLLEKDRIENPIALTLFNPQPCMHFGPCGPDNDLCSCKTMCSVLCQCSEWCVRKFPGCRCEPHKCGTDRCPCQKLGWECMERTCGTCSYSMVDGEAVGPMCKNNVLTRGGLKDLRISKSNVCDENGAFIAEETKEGEFIGEYIGEKISESETHRREYIQNLSGVTYIFHLKDNCGSVDGSRYGNQIRFINHDAANPNCFARIAMVEGKQAIGIFAKRDLVIGEELLLDYKNDISTEFLQFIQFLQIALEHSL